VTGRVAIVTGGTGALGQSIVLRFLRDGASVAVPWVVAEEWATLESRAADARPLLHGLRADVTDEAAMAAFLSDVLGRLQRVDVLVNAVGGFAGGDLASTPLPEWRRMMDLNLTSAVIASRAVLAPMTAARVLTQDAFARELRNTTGGQVHQVGDLDPRNISTGLVLSFYLHGAKLGHCVSYHWLVGDPL